MQSLYVHSITHEIEFEIDKGANRKLTGIFVDGQLLFSAAKYVAENKMKHGRSNAWESQFVQAVRLLIDYSIVHEGRFDNPKKMFESFATRLRDGIEVLSEGLLWSARSDDQTNRFVQHLTKFSDWLYADSGGKSELLNPKREATKAERILNLAAYNHRMNSSFLKHTYSAQHREEAVNYTRHVANRKPAKKPDEPKKTFPSDMFMPLLFEGFKKSKAKHRSALFDTHRVDYILITLLLNTYGLRMSEPFHLYVEDVIPTGENELIIKVFHPSKGLAPKRGRDKYGNQNLSRGEFLQREYGMVDRKSADGKLHVGWKIESLKEFPCFFFAENEYYKLFVNLFKVYLANRVEPMKGREHPFLFTDESGEPLTYSAYKQAHQRAVKKIGMTPLLEYNGAPHCHRHSYGQRLADAEVEPRIIKAALHQTSIESQIVYTEAENTKVQISLKEGTKKLEQDTFFDKALLPSSLASQTSIS